MNLSAGATLRVFIVDDHQLFRAGVRHEIVGQSGGRRRVEIVGEAGDVATAVERICQLVPDVVLVDVHMPDGAGPKS